MGLKTSWIVVFALFCVLHASADDSLPEFDSLTEQEQSAFDDPSLLGAEYQSDIYAFQKPFAWEYLWLTHDVTLDTSVGSIDSVRFLTDTRVKLKTHLKDWLEFRFYYFDDRNHDRQSSHPVLELVFWPWKRVGLSLYGEPSFNKRENDVGAAVLFAPSDHHEIRAFYTLVDVTRNKRSDRPDSFAEGSLPFARGVVGRLWLTETKDFLEYSFRNESHTVWKFPRESYEYRYSKNAFQVTGSRKWAETVRSNLRLQIDRKFEAKDSTNGATVAGFDAWTTTRALVTLQAEVASLWPEGWEFHPSFQLARRKWTTTRDELTYNDYLLGLAAYLPSGWVFDYSATIHDIIGGGAIAHPTDKDAVNHRLDIAYRFIFAGKGELWLKAGADLDKLGTGDSWEAGQAMFRVAL